MRKVIFIILLFYLNLIQLHGQQKIHDALIKANWIYIISNNVTFPEENKIDTMKIAIFGRSSDVFIYTKQLSQEKTIKNKPTKVYSVSKVNLLKGYNIVYVEEQKNDYINSIYNQIKLSSTLLITDHADSEKSFMINLLLQGAGNQFQIQSSNLFDANIIASEKLMYLGGTKVDLQALFEKKVEQLHKKELELQHKAAELQRKENELNIARNEIDSQKVENEHQSILITEKEKLLEEEKQNAFELQSAIFGQKAILNKNNYILQRQNIEIEEKKIRIDSQNNELETKKIEISEKQAELEAQLEEINSQKASLNIKNNQIDSQRQIIFASIIAIVLFFMLFIIILRSYRINKRINKELVTKNEKIEKQNDEITKQSAQLEAYNMELTKLSLVASNTENSVIIMDKESNFEWVNRGFTRMYGFTLQLLLNEKGKSLISSGYSPEERKKIIKRCIEDKKTITYEALNQTRQGEDIWVQTSLTPILDENGEIIKLIAVESNITKLKEQEKLIKHNNSELSAQKNKIEEANNHIKDSIKYALTIQKSILPDTKFINKIFDNFIINFPRDIVSGDFYWFCNPQDNIYLVSAVDCTGHGVPGAFMSLIASRTLNTIVIEKKIVEPQEILTTLNQIIIKDLNKTNSDNRDGMDLCLTKIDKIKSELTFSGAKRPLFYYQNKNKKLNIIKGNRKSIGEFFNSSINYEYTEKILNFSGGDIIYLMSDGLIDQNNKARKRFGTPRLLKLLEQIVKKPMEEQRSLIIEEFENYKENEPQRDDIIILGIKV